jgi:D-alanine--poly(phosphoribitol) ligase subunit 1
MIQKHNIGLVFERIAAATPRAPAVWCDGESLDYADLNRFANRLARWLIAKGISRGQVVCLELPKIVEAYALALACIKTGAPYVFMDAAGPTDRAAAVLRRCRPALVVSTREGDGPREVLASPESRKQLRRQVEGFKPANLNDTAAISGADPAYVMFTSGSTGEPKGAVIAHQGVLSLAGWARDFLRIVPADRLTNVNPLYFDNSVFDLYASLLNGASLVGLDAQRRRQPSELVRQITEHGCTLLFAVPTLFMYLDTMRLLTAPLLPRVRLFMFGGEGFPLARLQRFRAEFGAEVRLVNVYGPTETSCICTGLDIDDAVLTECERNGEGLPPLGHLNPNFSYRVLDDQLQAVHPGEAGELWLGGPCVGLGYLNNPEETERRFRQDPLVSGYRSILYRTGDLVKETPGTGVLRFRGRIDNQVKLRGYRVELEEIDHVLAALPGIARVASVMVRDANGLDKLFAAYSGDEWQETALADSCRAKLPVYMIPSGFVHMDAIPVNANGKADRRAIAAAIAGREGV